MLAAPEYMGSFEMYKIQTICLRAEPMLMPQMILWKGVRADDSEWPLFVGDKEREGPKLGRSVASGLAIRMYRCSRGSIARSPTKRLVPNGVLPRWPRPATRSFGGMLEPKDVLAWSYQVVTRSSEIEPQSGRSLLVVRCE